MVRQKKPKPIENLSEITAGLAECMAGDLDLIRSQTHPSEAGQLLPKQPEIPEVGDIIQVTDQAHPRHKAWIGIIHTVDGEELTCYQPDGRNPSVFRVKSGSCGVVGKARLKWAGPLPDKSKDYSRLDKV